MVRILWKSSSTPPISVRQQGVVGSQDTFDPWRHVPWGVAAVESRRWNATRARKHWRANPSETVRWINWQIKSGEIRWKDGEWETVHLPALDRAKLITCFSCREGVFRNMQNLSFETTHQTRTMDHGLQLPSALPCSASPSGAFPPSPAAAQRAPQSSSNSQSAQYSLHLVGRQLWS